MTTFWSLTAIMMLLALVFVIPPLWRQRQVVGVERVALNTQVIKDQLEELNADLAAGKLGQEDYDDARQDLERELLDNVAAEEAAGSGASGGRWMGLLLAVFIPAAAFFIYQQIGTQAIIPRLAAGPSSATVPQQSAVDEQTMESVVTKLAERMQQNPDNLEGWLLLGRSYASMSRFSEAVDAYERAWKLAGDNADVLSDYADVLVMASDGQFTARVGELLNKAVAADPGHIKARWLRGHWYFQQADYAAAITDWQQVAAGLPPGNKNLVIISEQIEAAQSRLGKDGESVPAVASAAPPATSVAAPAAAGSGIEVRVTLDESLLARAAPNDTLFIFARPVSGARMPLAIVRKQVSDLPVTVTLNDSMAMTPAMVLSKFDQVTVGARVSKSGQAMPASGDLQGVVTPVSTSAADSVDLLIDQVIP